MPHPHNLVALVSLLSLILVLGTGSGVAMARVKYGVQAPATTGHELFERAFRVQMNTLEQFVLFLPALWLFALYWNNRLAAALGLLWIVGRIAYWAGYVRDPKRREVGFGVGALATLILLVGGLIGAVRALIVTGGV